ncbi:MAG: hypothetical protein WC372_02465 [Candidatus Neomarinimicrobiota bacterium]|jgi:hypothetical protein|nr:hypothetical protein [Candidatus Neomarinimicrobiota bacterium]MDD3966513.1 hypothetical protein [Candidatus Neomarinimicrobiota bacterium]MDX9780741.1 hypothetical protein [bacterium]
MGKFTNFLEKLDSLDRRVIFLIIGLVVLIPLLIPLGLPIETTNLTEDAFYAIEDLPANAKVLLSFEYGPSSKPEIHPMAVSVLRHLFSKGNEVVIMCLWPDGLFMANEALELVAHDEFKLEYGVDYVNLGYRPGNEAVIKGITKSFEANFSVDSRGIPISQIPIMQDVQTARDVDFIFSFSAGYPGAIEWVLYAGDPLQVPVSSGNSSIQVNQLLPYVKSGQMKGVIAGMPGAAEYETLLIQKVEGKEGLLVNKAHALLPNFKENRDATKFMDAQSIAHLVIVLFIILGNISYFVKRKKQQKY